MSTHPVDLPEAVWRTVSLQGADGQAWADGLGGLQSDADRGALLVERLGGCLAETGLSLQAQTALLCRTLQDAWIVPACTDGLLSGAAKARDLFQFIQTLWEALKAPWSRVVLDTALECARRREQAYDSEACVLVHGDCHAHNALRVPLTSNDQGSGYKFVDPDGLFAERALDLGILMREWTPPASAADVLALERFQEKCVRFSARKARQTKDREPFQ